ncbi:type II secretion system protein GspL [Pantoea sp. Cy-639]|uniref:type II secretion system protein GspL n=1 Tax=Pantoea sp. Cy-639 TaxID=2608360 RepID=UPI00141F4A47|nr:type II secretion system protein GspL [Pantoea sp. Cy-639]NIF16241.1 type II secretion system protein GspL [Pantoea sp. Cy-639]
MKLEWRRRKPRRPWLLVRPGPAWDWLLLAQDRPLRQGQGRPPADLEARVALIVPGEACSHFQVAAPPGLKREEWPLLLEDRLLQDADQLFCACIERTPGQLRLLVVARAQLESWQAQCAEWALPLERCWAELQLLPTPATGDSWRWQRGGQTLCLGRDEQGHVHWLAWPQALGAPPAQTWQTGTSIPLDAAWPHTVTALDGLPGLFEARRARALPLLAPSQRRLVVACLVLATVWAGAWLSLQWRQAQLYREQVQAVTGPQATPGLAAQALRRLRDFSAERQLRLRQLESGQAQLQAWLDEHPGWRLRSAHFDGQRWRLELEGSGDTPPWQAMATTMGGQVHVEDGARSAIFDLEAA